MIEYYFKGTDRKANAIGLMEPFELTIRAPGDATREDLYARARTARYDVGREHVLITSLQRGPAVASPGAMPQGDQA